MAFGRNDLLISNKVHNEFLILAFKSEAHLYSFITYGQVKT